MKKIYNAPEVQIIKIDTDDIMVLSLGESGEGDVYDWGNPQEGISL